MTDVKRRRAEIVDGSDDDDDDGDCREPRRSVARTVGGGGARRDALVLSPMTATNRAHFATLNSVVLPFQYPAAFYDELLRAWSAYCFLGAVRCGAVRCARLARCS